MRRFDRVFVSFIIVCVITMFGSLLSISFPPPERNLVIKASVAYAQEDATSTPTSTPSNTPSNTATRTSTSTATRTPTNTKKNVIIRKVRMSQGLVEMDAR